MRRRNAGRTADGLDVGIERFTGNNPLGAAKQDLGVEDEVLSHPQALVVAEAVGEEEGAADQGLQEAVIEVACAARGAAGEEFLQVEDMTRPGRGEGETRHFVGGEVEEGEIVGDELRLRLRGQGE